LFLGIAALCVGVTLTVFAPLPPRPGVTKANFDQIQVGMNISEVERILGGTGLRFDGLVDRPALVWQGEDASFALIEVADNTVIGKRWHPSNETLLDKFRRWLHLPK
jgi:hypothetical protein